MISPGRDGSEARRLDDDGAGAAANDEPARWPWVRWLLLAGLLLAEGLALGVRFDSEALAGLPSGWWTPVLRPAGAAMPVLAAVLGALALVVGPRAVRALSDAALARRLARHRYAPYVALQLGCFGALFALSARLFAPGVPAADRHVGLLVAAWLGAAALTVAAAAPAFAPPRLLVDVGRKRLPLLAAAGAIGLAAFGVGKLAQGLWLPLLRRATFVIASGLLGAVGPRPVLIPEELTFGTDRFLVEIAPQCSGYEGIGLTWVFLLAAFWLFRAELRFPRALLLLVAGTIVPYLANAFRLVALILVGTYVSPELAAGGFHSYVGTLLFCTTALGIVAVALHWPWFSRSAAARRDPGRSANPAAPYLLPFLALVAAGLVARMLSSDASAFLFVLLRPIAATAALAAYARAYRTWPLRPSWLPSWLAVGAGLGAAAVWLAIALLLPRAAGSAAPAAGGSAAEVVAALGAGGLAVRLATTLVLAPIAEELAFRGFLARRISDAAFDSVAPARISWAGALISSVAFGLLHQRPIAGVAAGLIYVLVYRRTGRLGDAVVAHVVTNAVVVVIALITGRWELWT